ncbi:MAG: glycosyltransferase family 2 protein [Armatimonadota bacterium]|nr:glycosyltransferase family 2 protein [bacterium]
MDLSISIVSWNTCDILRACLKSIVETTRDIDYEIIVVDNASSDGSTAMVRAEFPQVILIENNDNTGFAKANNQAYELCSGRHFLLLNSDTICMDGALPELVRFLDEQPNIGIVGPLVLNADNTLQYSWARFPTLLSEVCGMLNRHIDGCASTPKNAEEVKSLGPFKTGWIGGCCMMLRRSVIEAVGAMDESFFMYCEEMDWCARTAAGGWEIWVDPTAEIVHLGGKSSAKTAGLAAGYLRASKAAYFAKHSTKSASIMLGLALSLKSRVAGTIRRLR